MAAPVKVTWFFNQAQTGWSETFYYPPGINSTLYQKIESVTAKRVDMLQTNHLLAAVRVSIEGANRFSRVFLGGRVNRTGFGATTLALPEGGKEDGAGSDVEGPPDQIRAALQIEVLQNGQRIATRYLAGIPDRISLTEPLTMSTNYNAKWWQLFIAWREELLAGQWAIKGMDKGAQYPLVNVQAYRLREAAPSILGVVIPSNIPWTHQQGQHVALQGVRMVRKGLTSPNKKWIIEGTEVVQNLGQRTIWLRGSEEFDPSLFFTLGKIRALSDAYIIPDGYDPLRVGVHKRGKPFGMLAGRRKTR